MRIVTWNCCRRPTALAVADLARLRADVCVLQEAAVLSGLASTWIGSRHGVLARARPPYYIEPIPPRRVTVGWFLPARVVGPTVSFNMLGVWAKRSPRRPIYVNTVLVSCL